MLKILIVDDDVEERESFKAKTDWLSYGCEVMAELSDGEMAYTLVCSEQPDIIITDLEMPYMDGLTLSRLIKEEYRDIEIIMRTSCEEFACIKEAVHIGISDYILKSDEADVVKEAIEKAADRINERRSIKDELEKHTKSIENERKCDKNSLFNELVCSGKTPAELIGLAKKNDIMLTAMCYSIMLINVVPAGTNREESESIMSAVDYELDEMAASGNVILFDRNVDGKAMIIKADSEEDMLERRETLIEQIKNILYKYDYIKFYGGVGTTVTRLGDIYRSYERAYRAYAQSYILNENLIIDSDEMEYGVLVAGDDFRISDIDIRGFDRNRVHRYLRFGDLDGVSDFIDHFFNDFGEDALESNTFRRFLIVDIYFAVCEFLEGLNYDRSEIESPDITYEILQNKENSKKYVINILEKAMSFRERSTRGRYGDIVDEVMRYIEDNYSDDKLSLNVLATHVNFSPNHLSMIFSQQTGTPFIKYLTDYRIGKAKELLRYTSKRSSEISSEVGYKDPHYFSYLFKKTQGMTPTQYRQQGHEQ